MEQFQLLWYRYIGSSPAIYTRKGYLAKPVKRPRHPITTLLHLRLGAAPLDCQAKEMWS
jgi:hypothetical protein